ncbi:MAG: SUMF1/EgtB/PvdO family nonheme iron enzyme [Phycisphaerae bacterium]|nr:SUMF1/EgtB/PvdO family nonheme iron enzyme [Phycisphaerae bacterium]
MIWKYPKRAVLVALVVSMVFTAARAAEPSAAQQLAGAKARFDRVSIRALRMAVTDLHKTFPKRYPKGPEYLKKLTALEGRIGEIRKLLADGDAKAIALVDELEAFGSEAMLANPLLDFSKLLLIKRTPMGDARRARGKGYGLGLFIGLPRQSSWQIDNLSNLTDWKNSLETLSPLRPDGRLSTVYNPEGKGLLSDIDLHYDANKLLFSLPDKNRNLQVFEIAIDPTTGSLAGGKNPRQISPSNKHGVHNFDPCYLPNEKIVFVSTAPLQAVPCNSSVNVAMAYVMDANGKGIRQLCFDQDHNYSPTVTNDGRILYLRWEYTDLPHVWGRYLFTMNPDGTSQREYYGSGSYWPNGIFYARPIPGHPTRVVGIVTGHHVGRIGELTLFDPALGNKSTQGVIQRIPGYGKKVEALIQDRLTENSWPKFLHPFPLGDAATRGGAGKYFIVSAKPTPSDLWGIYLVDIFDNMTLIKEIEDYVLVEPIPLKKRKLPPVIPDRVDPSRKDAAIYIENVYRGPGLAGVPKGSIKKLRLFTYHFAYRRSAGINYMVGIDGPWEPKRVLGTVDVESDGSVLFSIPANTPISIQPLDEKGMAVQLMRSWMTAMPGEVLSCVGCHEKNSDGAPNNRTIAARGAPKKIVPWKGPVRGFSFSRDVQPVLDKYCAGCHDGKRRKNRPIPDLRRDQGRFIVFRNRNPKPTVIEGVSKRRLFGKYSGVFEPSFVELRAYLRVPGLESDLRMLNPYEFHPATSELVQMLTKGHHGVKLDADAWDRLVTWIDLNAPCHGTWRDTAGSSRTQKDHGPRRELRKLYASINDDPEELPVPAAIAVKPIKPARPVRPGPKSISCDNWPMDAKAAGRLQAAAGPVKQSVDLGGGVKLDLVRIPAGQFVMGDPNGHIDELPLAKVPIAKSFWMGKFEVTNAQYHRFNSAHESRFEHKGSWKFSERHLGWDLDGANQPVVRVSAREATAFCQWLSKKVGRRVTLPTEAQWEYACRAGSDQAMSYGDTDSDFSTQANMADATIRRLAYDTDGRYTGDLTPRDARFDDRGLVTTDVGGYKPNAWGLCDMHGNAAEWTRSAYKPYPCKVDDGRNSPKGADSLVVRGGSWRDRPKRCTSAFRMSYKAWQKVYNVGFRVVVESDGQ